MLPKTVIPGESYSVVLGYKRSVLVRRISIVDTLSLCPLHPPVTNRYDAGSRLIVIMLSGLQCTELRFDSGGYRLSIWIPLDIFISGIGRPCLSIRRKGDIRTVIDCLCRLCRKCRKEQQHHQKSKYRIILSLFLHSASLLFFDRQKKARTVLFGLFKCFYVLLKINCIT